ncbi:serine/threonine dehydratase [Dactylosporangium vinaceum]|uniref:Serine/threonine dehydratase n=1 Tax=Dactylosporangium vinaceum TaxID=53362 RepID=A0ABV5MN09_9ACTN|nr:serine/threonine dehydratase [Dactylosporangium vinaceum]UAB98594.1 serine/threonine dehydratase [Dactylosporangium vinaceum]
MVNRDDLEAAARRIEGYIRPTPSYEVRPGLWFKLELLQHSGSFKARGAFNRILAAREEGTLPSAGVIVASGGNAGLGVAYAAATLGVRAEVFVPVTAPATKVARLRDLGAHVHRHGREYAEAHAASMIAVAETGAMFVHAYDQPEIVAGQGTVGLELPRADTVLVAVGGGGLVAGVAAAVGDRSRVVAVEPEGVPTLHAALAAGAPVDVAVDSVAGDSLGARRVGTIAFDLAVRNNVASVLVTDEEIVAARRRLWLEHRLAVEHGAAAALAGLDRLDDPGTTVVVLCGANTDPSTLYAETAHATG